MRKHVFAMVPVFLFFALPVWTAYGQHDHDHGHGHGHGHDEGPTAKLGEPAPDFTLTDANGKKHKLSDYKGKVIVLEWTNHTCPFVQRHQGKERTMQKTFASFKDKPVAWLAVDSSHFCEDKIDGVRAWAKKNDLPYPVLLDADGKVGHMYGAKTTPHMFVIDKKGVLAYSGAIDDDPYGSKESDKNYVAEAVRALLNGSAVPVASTKSYGCSVKYKK